MTEFFILKVYRGEPGCQYFEEFELPLREGENVISALMEIQKRPYNRYGQKVTPVVWEQGCLEEVCGSCSVLINGYPRQACTALISHYVKKDPVVTVAPFTKFPLVRDLIVDRTRMFENLKRVRAWVEKESREEGFGPLISQEKQQVMYALSTCMTCGCCSEGCPQVNKKSAFIGPAPISQARFFNMHPVGAIQSSVRNHSLMEEGGVSECGNAQNCVEVCPKKIPLTESIAEMGKEVAIQAVKDFF
jgi:succinate dehydrogenase / fumarate reductase iron-sulfur subunit